MNYDVWERVIGKVFVLCGIRKMEEQEHALYIAEMWSELKNKFTDTDIGLAARSIAEKENLYGSYPSLAIWLKYCPSIRTNQIANSASCAGFMEHIDYVMNGDVMYFDMDSSKKKVWELFGERARVVVSQFGGLNGIRNRGFGASKIEQEILMREIRTAWNSSEVDIKIGVHKIAAAMPKLLKK